MTQRETVFLLLRSAGQRGICLADVPEDVGYCLRNRVSDLSKLGYNITAKRCRIHNHRGGVSRYVLEGLALGSNPTELDQSPSSRGLAGEHKNSSSPKFPSPASPSSTPPLPSRASHRSPASDGAAGLSTGVPAAPLLPELFPEASPLRAGHSR